MQRSRAKLQSSQTGRATLLVVGSLTLLLLIVFPGTFTRADDLTVHSRYGQSVRGEIGGIEFLMLRGTRQEQGEAHGVLAAKDILRVLNDTLIAHVEKQPGAWDGAILPMVRKFSLPAHYLLELEALLRGLQKTLKDPDDRIIEILKREVRIEDLQALNCVGDIMSAGSMGCSSFSIWGSMTPGGETISARNLDYTTFPGRIPFLVIAREPVESDRLATLDLSGPGVLGVSTVMNREGIVLMQHDEGGLPAQATSGFTPRLLVNRDAIESLRLGLEPDQIVQLFSGKTVITGTNSHISFPSRNSLRACVVEWDGNSHGGGATFRLPDEETSIICTNHFLERRLPRASGGSSERRMGSLADAIDQIRRAGATMGLEEAKQAMHKVAASGKSVTYLTCIAYPDERRIVFATTPDPGVPATKGRYVEISWDDIFSAR